MLMDCKTEELELIDFETKGNLIRLYLGKNGEQHGDSWFNKPYQYNGGRVHSRYVEAIVDLAIPFDLKFIMYHEEKNDDRNDFNKYDLVKRNIYAFGIITDDGEYKKIDKFYFGDKLSMIIDGKDVVIIDTLDILKSSEKLNN